MVCCFLYDEERELVGNRGVNGVCRVCAGTVRDVRVQNVFRFCFVPVCWSHTSRIICSRCGAHYKSRWASPNPNSVVHPVNPPLLHSTGHRRLKETVPRTRL